MESHEYVLGLLESIFGKGKKDRVSFDYAFHCPFCGHRKPKLIVNIQTGRYNCWTCHPPTKGKTPVSLLVKYGADDERVKEMKSYFQGDQTIIKADRHQAVLLPKEFISITNNDRSLDFRQAISYLKNRGISELDVVKYNIGYCKTGRFRNKIIIPSYSEKGQLQYFIARSYEKDPMIKYDAPSVSKSEIIGFENFINWTVPVILCEGVFDAIAIKRNAIPLFGKTIPKALMLKLVETQVKTIYLALDKDALKEALTYSQTLLDHGKEVYLLELEGKDPSDLGFEKMIQLLHKAKPITFGDLIMRRFKM